MIFYFSATGNSKYVAERIATELDTQTIDIVEALKEGSLDYEFEENEAVGIISPTYFWGVPTIVKEFLQKVKLSGKIYLFYISTYGTTTGQTGNMADSFLKDSGKSIEAMFSIKMPDSWTPVFDLSDPEKVKKTNEKAEQELAEVIHQLKLQKTGNHMKHKVPKVMADAVHRTYKSYSKTSHFSVEDSCIGCGLCEKKCPAKAIEIQNGKPVWVKDQCIMCLGCLHRCPKFSIQYGKRTKMHGQYLNPNTRV